MRNSFFQVSSDESMLFKDRVPYCSYFTKYHFLSYTTKVGCGTLPLLRAWKQIKKNAENDYFDQRLGCAVPKHWSKYTTMDTTYNTFFIFLSTFYPFFCMEIKWKNRMWAELAVYHNILSLNQFLQTHIEYFLTV